MLSKSECMSGIFFIAYDLRGMNETHYFVYFCEDSIHYETKNDFQKKINLVWLLDRTVTFCKVQTCWIIKNYLIFKTFKILDMLINGNME